ncbi:MAG: peptidoglycan-binding protein [bacterium]|nr:peptidoglycan-binding protein [bacterium]
MEKILSVRTNIAFLATFLALFLMISLGMGAYQAHAATISTSLDFGSRGQEVTDLQTYLAGYPALYPSGLVTGYFGSLTQAAVQRFQTEQGIVSSGSPTTTGYGRVGPQTIARLNTLMGGVSSNVSWDTVPVQSPISVQYTGTTATFSWTTNEPTRGQVYWSTTPIQSDEATGPNQTPYVSGTLALDAGGLQTNHVVTVSNLQANTTYYYLVRSIDSVGNITMILPRSFATGSF